MIRGICTDRILRIFRSLHLSAGAVLLVSAVVLRKFGEGILQFVFVFIPVGQLQLLHRPYYRKVLIYFGVHVGQSVIDIEIHFLIDDHIHEFRHLAHRIITQDLDGVSVLNAVISRLQLAVDAGESGQIHRRVVDLHPHDGAELRQLIDINLRRLARRRFRYLDLVIGVDGRIDIRLVAVDRDHCRLPEGASRNTRPAVDRIVQFLPPFREKAVAVELCLHGGIHHRHLVVVVDLDPLFIEIYENKVIALFVEAQTDPDRCDHQRISSGIRLQKLYVLHDLSAAHGHSLLLNAEFPGQGLRVSRQRTAAAHHENSAHRSAAVEFLDLVGHLSCHVRDHIRRHFCDLVPADRLRQPHDILILYLFPAARIPFDLLRRGEIHQTVPCDHLRQAVARHRDHPVGNNAAVLRDGDIRSAGSYIHQRDIQHPVHLRDRHLNRRDRLQRQIDHVQPRQIHGLVQTVHHILRQKRGDQIRPDRFRPVALQVAHRIAVHVIPHDGITDAVELHIRNVILQEHFIGLLHTGGIQRIDVLSVDFSVTVPLHIHPDGDRAQHTSGGRDADVL